MKELQKIIKTFCLDNGLQSPAEHRVLDAMSELGEVAKEILLMSSYGRKPLKHSDEIKSELGDLLFSVITIANSFNVDLEEALDLVFEKYKRRMMHGSPGSEVELE
jgi:NTP pyrophosphatase (non-canonical NTP hydrolase)